MKFDILKDLRRKDHPRYLGGLDIFRYIGPGLLVTVGFIDPGNWASNFAAGSEFGYMLLWVVAQPPISHAAINTATHETARPADFFLKNIIILSRISVTIAPENSNPYKNAAMTKNKPETASAFLTVLFRILRRKAHPRQQQEFCS